MTRGTDGKVDPSVLDENNVQYGNEEHVNALRQFLVGSRCIQAGEHDDGALVLEFEDHVLVFSGIFVIAPRSEIKERPPNQ